MFLFFPSFRATAVAPSSIKTDCCCPAIRILASCSIRIITTPSQQSEQPSASYQTCNSKQRMCIVSRSSNAHSCEKAIVRRHLEYCIQAWNPYLRKDIDMLGKIQRRVTKLIPGLIDVSYEERLKECGLTTLEMRRLKGSNRSV